VNPLLVCRWWVRWVSALQLRFIDVALEPVTNQRSLQASVEPYLVLENGSAKFGAEISYVPQLALCGDGAIVASDRRVAPSSEPGLQLPNTEPWNSFEPFLVTALMIPPVDRPYSGM